MKVLFFNVEIKKAATSKLKAWSWRLEAGSWKLKSRNRELNEIALLCFGPVLCRDCRDIRRGTLHFTVETVGTKVL